MTTNTRSGKSGIEILEAVRIDNPKIVGLLSLGCGRKMGWGNNCHIRHLCFDCQAVRSEISRLELEKMIICIETITDDKSLNSFSSRASHRYFADAEIIERIQKFMKTAGV